MNYERRAQNVYSGRTLVDDAVQCCSAEVPETFPAMEGLSLAMMNRLDAMQDHGNVLIERLSILADRLIGGEEQKLTRDTINKAQPVCGTLNDVLDRINDLDDKLRVINYHIGRLESI